MNNPDKWQQAWQSQCIKPAEIEPWHRLNMFRLQRRVYFWIDVFKTSVYLYVGVLMLGFVFRDIQKNWPWLISSGSIAWVVGYIWFNHWHRRRHAPHYDEPLLAHVEWSIKYNEHRIRQAENWLWWDVLPLALGFLIPLAISLAMDHRNPELDALFDLLFALLVLEGIFIAFRHVGREGLRHELQVLRSLRESILNTEETHV